MVRHFYQTWPQGNFAGCGATGLIVTPDGKKQSATCLSLDEIAKNKAAIAGSTGVILESDIGWIITTVQRRWLLGLFCVRLASMTHAPVCCRIFGNRLGRNGAGGAMPSSVQLIQRLRLFAFSTRKGRSRCKFAAPTNGAIVLRGVDFIAESRQRKKRTFGPHHLFLIRQRRKKFGKSEAGAVWLDPAKPAPTQFYQFWINCDDDGVEDYLKIYTLLDKNEIEKIMARHRENPGPSLRFNPIGG